MKPKYVRKKDLREISRRLSAWIEGTNEEDICYIAADLDLLIEGE